MKEILELLRPDVDALMVQLRELVDDRTLRDIAEADHGFEAGEYFAELLKIRALKDIPLPTYWIPREVLELIRWSEPDRTDWKPGGVGMHGHIMRAFACAALLWLGTKPENEDLIIGENDTLVQLLASLEHLDSVYQKAAIRFLSSRLSSLPEDYEERPFFIFALLLLVLKTPTDLSETHITEIARWLLSDEKRIKQSAWATLPNYATQWLLGLTFYNQRYEVWLTMGQSLSNISEKISNPELRAEIDTITSLLSFISTDRAY